MHHDRQQSFPRGSGSRVCFSVRVNLAVNIRVREDQGSKEVLATPSRPFPSSCSRHAPAFQPFTRRWSPSTCRWSAHPTAGSGNSCSGGGALYGSLRELSLVLDRHQWLDGRALAALTGLQALSVSETLSKGQGQVRADGTGDARNSRSLQMCADGCTRT